MSPNLPREFGDHEIGRPCFQSGAFNNRRQWLLPFVIATYDDRPCSLRL
jgi:hypothetical protein